MAALTFSIDFLFMTTINEKLKKKKKEKGM
jgi:hypothetical protein